MVSCIPQNEMVVFAGDMNAHIGIAMLAMMGHMVVLGIDSECQNEIFRMAEQMVKERPDNGCFLVKLY